jgi:hypothetical protein
MSLEDASELAEDLGVPVPPRTGAQQGASARGIKMGI